jgi:hypothetical protein
MTREKIEDYVLFSALLGSVTPGEDTWLIDSGSSKNTIIQRDILFILTENNLPKKLSLGYDY